MEPASIPTAKAGPFARWRKRRRRDRRELRMLRRADLVVVSFRKSGRTWLRAMVSHLYHQRHGVPERELIEADNLARRFDPTIPSVLFTHDLPWDPWNARWRRLLRPDPFRDKRVLLLVRDPRDAATSLYFQLARRQRPEERIREGLPADASGTTVGQFLLDRRHAQLARCIDFLNVWAARARRLPDVTVLRYEDMRADPFEGLRRAARLLGDFGEEEIRRSVAFADFASLREKEAAGFFRSQRLQPGDPGDPESFKVRRGAVGGWRDYVSPVEAAAADALVSARLCPDYGYAATEPRQGPTREASPSRATGGDLAR